MVTVFISPVGRRELIPFVQPLDEVNRSIVIDLLRSWFFGHESSEGGIDIF